MAPPLSEVLSEGTLDQVKQAFIDNPNVDIHQLDELTGWTCLALAAANPDIAVLEFMLALPDIDVNACDEEGVPLVLHVCMHIINYPALECILRDPRVNTQRDVFKNTPCYCRAITNSPHILKLFVIYRLADLDVDYIQNYMHQKWDHWGQDDYDDQVKNLLSDLQFDRDVTVMKIFLEYEHPNAASVYLFALNVMHCDDYLKLSTARIIQPSTQNTLRFFAMINKLPMELQMLLCNRTYGLVRDIIPVKDFNTILKYLFRIF
jgi:hypothetical protein